MQKSHPKLRGQIVCKYGNQSEFAGALGVSEQTVNAKLAGRVGLSSEDIVKWSNLLDIKVEDIGSYFFDD